MIRTLHLAPHMPGVAELVIDRPEKRNALTPAALADLASHAAALDADPSVRAIVLRGEGRHFCAGFDLLLCRDDPHILARLLTGLSHAVRVLRRLSKPVVGAVHGSAIAGGCALLGGCDIVITHPDAKLGYPVLPLGISPAVSYPTLRLAVGDRHARQLLLHPALITGEDARRLGLVHRIVHIPEDVIPRAQIEASQLASKPPHAVAATKRWLNTIDGSLDDAAFNAALSASTALVGSPEERTLLARAWSA
ncbi:MAG: enoyl-CoA hydratase/isomerase family protein [Phycisphaerales bacterium]|nr:enoyl-CoA hydratase/isomerase family protein [Phycisphaerales bacterium]